MSHNNVNRWLAASVLLLMAVVSRADNIELKSQIENATVEFYALNGDEKGDKITSVAIGTEFILADIQPADGYWTELSKLQGAESLADIGRANARRKTGSTDLVSFSENGTIEAFGETQANGGGLYKLGITAIEGVSCIVLNGTMAEQTAITTATITITAPATGQTLDKTGVLAINPTDVDDEAISMTIAYDNGNPEIAASDVAYTATVTLTCNDVRFKFVDATDVTIADVESIANKSVSADGKTLSVEATFAATTQIVVKVKDVSREYGAANPAFEYEVTGGEIGGEPVITTEATTASPVGPYTISIEKGTVTPEGVQFESGTLTIEEAPLTIMVVGEYTRKQGEENPEFKLEYDGFRNDETEEVLTKKPVITCTATKDSEPGEYEISVSGAEAQNYEITYVAGKLTVVQADAVVVTAKSYSREYGEKNPEFEFTSEGAALSGEPEITCEATENSPIGEYPIVIKKGSVTNYNDSYVNGTLTVTKAPLTIMVVGEYTRKQGEENPEFRLEYDGFKNGETEEVLTKKPVITCTATKDSEPGEYEITVSGAEAQNYEITYVAGKLTVTEPEKPDNVFEEDGISYEQLDDNTVAFSGDTNATGEYTIPETVTYDGVVYQVTEIAANAFKDNTDLRQVTIPGSVISIGENAFAGCTNLSMIVIYVTDPNISKVRTRATAGNAFGDVDKETCVLYVPAGSLEDYRNSEGWKDFKNIRPIGDANGDTIINAADIVEEVNCIMNNPSEKFIKAAADLNGDGVVNAADIVEMVNIIMSAK